MTPEKMAITVEEMAHELGISKPIAYELTRRKGFPAIRVSERRIIIPVDRFREWLNDQTRE
jgi:excisionase family DNA binding protein